MTLAGWRRANSKSQEDAAASVGVDRSMWTLLENRRTRPSIRLAMRIAEMVGASVEELFDADGFAKVEAAQGAGDEQGSSPAPLCCEACGSEVC